MINLARLFKDYNETGALNEYINLYGFVADQVFLTKSGDLGAVIHVDGIDHECLDQNTLDNVTRRFEAAMRGFGEQYRIYQYLLKRNHESIPHRLYDSELVSQAIETRSAFLASRSEELYSIQIYYVVLYQGFRHRPSLTRAVSRLFTQPGRGLKEILGSLSTRTQVALIESDMEAATSTLLRQVESFIAQLSDLCQVTLLHKDEAFCVLKRLLNFAPHKIESARRKHNAFLDYYLPDSTLECHRGHLLVDDYFVKVLTLKEPSSQSFPLIFKQLLEVEASFIICTEWHPEDGSKIQNSIQSRRRHYHNSKMSIFSQLGRPEVSRPKDDFLVDDSKESLIQELGDANKEIVIHGHTFGEFSLTVVLYDRDLARIDHAISTFSKIFSTVDAVLIDERYNLLNAFLAVVPGNYQLNLRRMYLLNTNYADYAFFFTLHQGERENKHLGSEYLAVLESTHKTPYYLNLHHGDLAHTTILGKSGSGKSFLLNFLITFLQKYSPYTFILDMGGSYRSLTEMFGGSYLQVGLQSQSFSISPFCLPLTRDNLNFLFAFVSLLIDDGGKHQLSHKEERDLFDQIEMMYSIDPRLRTLSTLRNTLPDTLKEALHKWTQAGQLGFLFDNPEDTLTFSKFQCIEFEGMEKYPQLIEPLLFYLLHRANALIEDDQLTGVLKAFIVDEAWVFFRNATIKNYIVRALKTWRKKNAAMILATQSVDELKNSDILNLILESCSTKIFLANPDMDRDLYQGVFHLNDKEVDLITTLIPKQQMLIKRPDITKVVNLNVDPVSYWLYTSDPMDNLKKKEVIAQYGLTKGLQILARRQFA